MAIDVLMNMDSPRYGVVIHHKQIALKLKDTVGIMKFRYHFLWEMIMNGHF